MSELYFMKWLNSKGDFPPSNNEEVEISVKGIYYDAVFYSRDNSFHVKNNIFLTFNPKDSVIYWRPKVIEESIV